MNNIIGHQQIKDFFAQVSKADRLSHAYIFVGPQHVGKRAFARALAADLLHIPVQKLAVHPDVTRIHQEKNPKTGKTKKHIDIDQIRRVRSALSRYSAMGGKKIAIIDEAEKMNVNASNALLKTLEEPSKDTILFLITHDPEGLLPTIRSRAQQIMFRPVLQQTIVDALNDHTERADIARYARGLPGKAMTWSHDAEAFSDYKQSVEAFYALLGKPWAEKQAQIADVFGDKTDHIATRETLDQTLALWQILIRDCMVGQAVQDIPVSWNPQEMVRSVDMLGEVRQLLRRNVHPKLAVERMLLELP